MVFKKKQPLTESRGNLPREEIYRLENAYRYRKNNDENSLNRLEYVNPKEVHKDMVEHPAYNTDLIAFQHVELWLPNLDLYTDPFSEEEHPEVDFANNRKRKTPTVLTSRIGMNQQNVAGINLRFGSLDYSITDFETKNHISADRSPMIKKNKEDTLPRLFDPGYLQNWGVHKDLEISMWDGYEKKDLFELIINDKKKRLFGRFMFQTKWGDFENAYTEVLNSGDRNFPIINLKNKRWLKFVPERSSLRYKGEKIDLGDSRGAIAYVDESFGFPPKQKNWDWMIYKSTDRKRDVRMIIGKRCQRAGFFKTEMGEIATLFIDGKIYRLGGSVSMDYNIDDLTQQWGGSLWSMGHSWDGSPWGQFRNWVERLGGIKNNRQKGKYEINFKTNYVAPLVEKSELNIPTKMTLDLQRVMANVGLEIIVDGEKIISKGVASCESNAGMNRGTKYFKD